MKDSGGHKETWYRKNVRNGLRVKLARDEGGRIVGMIQYIPAEHAPIVGKGIHYVYCVWVHGHKEGVGNHQKKGIGKLLLHAAEEDARRLGSKGLAAWGLRLPFFMRSAWFKRQGYTTVDTDGMMELVLKPFAPDVEPPRFLEARKKPERGADKVRVTCLKNGWCPAQNIVYERARRAAEAHPAAVEFVGVDTDDRERLLEYGMSDALFIDDRQVRTGPPPSYDKIDALIRKQLKRRKLPA